MKLQKMVCAPIATLTLIGSLIGEANAALILNFDDSSGNTLVTLTATNLNLTGLTSGSTAGSFTSYSTFIRPIDGAIGFTGSYDINNPFETTLSIPSFSFGSGGNNSIASMMGTSNPFIALHGSLGRILVDDDNPLPTNFVATATYFGSFVDNGIDDTPQTITFSNNETLSISFNSVPEPSSSILIGLGTVGLLTRRHRAN